MPETCNQVCSHAVALEETVHSAQYVLAEAGLLGVDIPGGADIIGTRDQCGHRSPLSQSKVAQGAV